MSLLAKNYDQIYNKIGASTLLKYDQQTITAAITVLK
jgi:hypothetical protein